MAIFVQSGSVVGKSINIGGGRVVINGEVFEAGDNDVVVLKGKPLPDVEQEYDGITAVEINDNDVYLTTGEKFKAVGKGTVRKAGSTAIVEMFTGEIELPDLGKITIKVNSGSVRGSVASQSIEAKANSGSITLDLLDRGKPVSIEAKANAGNISITVK